MFPKIGVPQIIHFNRVFHYKPSILGYPYFWTHPYVFTNYHQIPFYFNDSWQNETCDSLLFKTDTVDGSEIPNNHPTCMNPVENNGIFTISTGAGFLPSTVSSNLRHTNVMIIFDMFPFE